MRIDRSRDWLEHTKFWKQQRDELRRAIDDVGWANAGDESIKRYRLMEAFTGNISDVLALFAGVVPSRTFDDFLKYGFDEQAEGASSEVRGRHRSTYAQTPFSFEREAALHGGTPLQIVLGSDQNYERIEHFEENGLFRRSIHLAVCNNGDSDIHDCNIRLTAATPPLLTGTEKTSYPVVFRAEF